MKTTQMQLRFDAAKLKALEFYLPNNGTSVEQECPLNNCAYGLRMERSKPYSYKNV